MFGPCLPNSSVPQGGCSLFGIEVQSVVPGPVGRHIIDPREWAVTAHESWGHCKDNFHVICFDGIYFY